jgi:hypothetical protein
MSEVPLTVHCSQIWFASRPPCTLVNCRIPTRQLRSGLSRDFLNDPCEGPVVGIAVGPTVGIAVGPTVGMTGQRPYGRHYCRDLVGFLRMEWRIFGRLEFENPLVICCMVGDLNLQGYLAHKKTPPCRALS